MTLPIAIPGFFFKAAVTDVASSGKEVPPATNVSPITDFKCYWFHTKSGYMFKNRRVTRSTGDIYYFGSDGVRCENGMYKIREKSGEHTYYFQKNGKAYTAAVYWGLSSKLRLR